MNEITKDPISGTDNTFDDNTQKLAQTIQELNSVIADVNEDTFSDTGMETSPKPSINPMPAKTPAPSPERRTAPMQQPYNSGMQQTAVPRPMPQYTQPPQPSYQPYPNPAPMPTAYPQQPMQDMQANMKFCKFCAARIPADAVICTACGRQVEQLAQQSQQPVIINNTNMNNNNNTNNVAVPGLKAHNKWAAFLLCLFLGYLGAHKFYEGRVVSGLLYLFTFGLFGFGWFIDTIALLLKPNPYYTK